MEMSDPDMNASEEPRELFIYDVILSAIDQANRVLIFRSTRGIYRVPFKEPRSPWSIGTVGRLRLTEGERSFVFHEYADALLRRAPGLDNPLLNRWGWRLAERRFALEAGIVPGRQGAFVQRDTEPLTLDLPREFRALCAARGLLPETVLRSFIADLCGLCSWDTCPREDRYCGNGSDEHDMAQAYFRRVYGWSFDVEPSANTMLSKNF
jgi:hypothetical protein